MKAATCSCSPGVNWSTSRSDQAGDGAEGLLGVGGHLADHDRGIAIIQRNGYSMTGYTRSHSDFLGRLAN